MVFTAIPAGGDSGSADVIHTKHAQPVVEADTTPKHQQTEPASEGEETNEANVPEDMLAIQVNWVDQMKTIIEKHGVQEGKCLINHLIQCCIDLEYSKVDATMIDQAGHFLVLGTLNMH